MVCESYLNLNINVKIIKNKTKQLARKYSKMKLSL